MKKILFTTLILLSLVPCLHGQESFSVAFKGKSPEISDFVTAILSRDELGEVLGNLSQRWKRHLSGKAMPKGHKFTVDTKNGYLRYDAYYEDEEHLYIEYCYWNCADGKHKLIGENISLLVHGRAVDTEHTGISYYWYDNDSRTITYTYAYELGAEVEFVDGTTGCIRNLPRQGKNIEIICHTALGKVTQTLIWNGESCGFSQSAPKSDAPMFLHTLDKEHMQMVYWCEMTEPVRNEYNADDFDNEHASWALQESFRRNADRYTNLVTPSGKIVRLTYTGELLKDPNGEDLFPGQLHSSPTIPSPGLNYRFTSADNTLKDDELRSSMWVVVTDDFLKDHNFVLLNDSHGKAKPLPAKVLTQLEKQYQMKTERSLLLQYNKRFSYGIQQFKGPWKSRVDAYGDTTQVSLALEVFIVDGKVYTYPVEGYYDDAEGPSWNADDGGEYLPGSVIVFDGPDGPLFCHMHGAPESVTISLFTLRDGELERNRHDTYHALYDEAEPTWDE